MTTWDVVVIGAGSAGLGAALAAARRGCEVLLVEQAPAVGGIAAWAGVNVWEPGVGGTGLPYEIYCRLRNIPGAVGIYAYARHCTWENGQDAFPGALFTIDPKLAYTDTLLRHGMRSIACEEQFCREKLHGVVFEPAAYRAVVMDMLAATGSCSVALSTGIVTVRASGGQVHELVLSDDCRVRAKTFIDASGESVLCRMCGCEVFRGREGREVFAEPGAPEHDSNEINGVSLMYRITPTKQTATDQRTNPPEKCWWKPDYGSACFVRYPCGDYNVNMLPTMTGEEYLACSPSEAYAKALRRVHAHWRHVRHTVPEFHCFAVSWIAPQIGVREGWRVRAEYTLTQHDLAAGLSRQTHPDIICIADHPMDTHGRGGICGEVSAPYGIPFRCLVPRGMENVLTAGRGAGFSAIAASSARLSRTMMQLGQAAGTAAALARKHDVPVAAVNTDCLCEALAADHVQLQWPTPSGLLRYLGRQDHLPLRTHC